MSDNFRSYPANDEAGAPVVFEPVAPGHDIVEWVSINKQVLDRAHTEHGAVLLRNFSVERREDFSALVNALGRPVEYVFRSTPRTSVGANIYTATEYPKEYSIPVHCENAYQSKWPMKLFFFCERPATSGGATPLANIREVTQKISPEIRKRFQDEHILYVRNYGQGIDLNWQEVFQTESRSEVEAYCRAHDIAFEWKKAGGLRTRQKRPAMARHPASGEELWFNQAHLFHVSSHEPEMREAMAQLFSEADLPRNAYYGDGSALEDEVLEEIRAAYRGSTFSFPWKRNDVLIVDNMRFAHGRQPFEGERKVLVMMSDVHDPGA
jgi:alpha-ketoglutarate-dependent taurine dioxygenase